MSKMLNKELKRYINKLGGVSLFGENIDLSESEKLDFINKYEIAGHDSFMNFIQAYGGRGFNEEVLYEDIDTLKELSMGRISVLLFLGFIEGGFSIIDVNELIEDNLPSGYIAFAMGDPTGDYWVYHMESKGIYFWKHDNPRDEDLFFVADSLEKFIKSLEIKI